MYATKNLGEQHPSSKPPVAAPKLPPEVWEELRKPFTEDEIIYHIDGGAMQGGRVVVEPIPEAEWVVERLDRVLGPEGYSYWHEVWPSGTAHAATCHLQIGGAVRTGVYSDSDPEKAAALALVRAAQAFHIGWQARAVGRFVAHLPPMQEGNIPEEVVAQLEKEEGLTPPPLGPEAPPAEEE